MGSNYFGEANMGNNERGGGSSRKRKKSNNDSKPKQPQRGLGVAQLEKIRLHAQFSSSSSTTTLHHLNPTYPHPTFNQDDIRMQPIMPSSSFALSSPSSTSYALHYPSNLMMGLNEYERTNIRYGDSQQATTLSWNPNQGILETQHFPQQNITRHFLNSPHLEESKNKSKKHRSNSMGSCNSDSSDTQELDLELRLSL